MLLTGRSLGLIRPAVAIARELTPATVVLEDVDLGLGIPLPDEPARAKLVRLDGANAPQPLPDTFPAMLHAFGAVGLPVPTEPD